MKIFNFNYIILILKVFYMDIIEILGIFYNDIIDCGNIF